MPNKIHWILTTKRNILNQNKKSPPSSYSKEIIDLAARFKKDWNTLTKSIQFIHFIDENNVKEAEKLAKKILDIK